MYYYYTEQYEKSKSILNESLNKKLPKLYYYDVIYQLVLLDIKEGNIEKARERLLSIEKAVKNIYLNQKVNEELKKL